MQPVTLLAVQWTQLAIPSLQRATLWVMLQAVRWMQSVMLPAAPLTLSAMLLAAALVASWPSRMV